MNIFVLSTGRCGSMTFATACSHLTNFTSGHESRASQIGRERFIYPNNHIEVDNRLSWHLGLLGKHYDPNSLYVHLKRDPEKVTRSFAKRWHSSKYRASIIRAFANGIVMKMDEWPQDAIDDMVRFYIDTVNENISAFIKSRHHLEVNLEDGGESFNKFLRYINAQGDLDRVMSVWREIHNAS